VPVFLYRHYVQDKGKLPDDAMAELGLVGQDMGPRKAGVLPYVTLVAGAILVLACNYYFKLPV